MTEVKEHDIFLNDDKVSDFAAYATTFSLSIVKHYSLLV